MAKKSTSTSKRPIALVALVLILAATNIGTIYYFMFYRQSVPSEDVPLSIGDVTSDPASLIGKTVTILGYYVLAAGFSLLVENLMLYLNNSLSPLNYVMITGQVPSSMQQYLGAECAVKGVAGWADADDAVVGIAYREHSDRRVSGGLKGAYEDMKLNTSLLQELKPFQYDPDATKYALLYSGGIKPEKAYYRYWNDIIYMHFILTMHGYEPENIYVIYKDGVGEDPYTPVDYPATHNSLNTVFAQLSSEMGARDTLFFYTTNHGGSGGISVWNPMDATGALTHTQVSNWLDSITCDQMIIVMEQCVSGKFIEYISAANRVILTACADDESSYSCDSEGNWDEFVYHFMSALIGMNLPGGAGTTDADYSNDGKISMREAFLWAALHDSRSETPWYNDNGDDYGYNVYQVALGAGPWSGDAMYL